MLPSHEYHQPAQLGFEQLAVLAVSRMATVELCRVTQGEPLGAVVAVKRLPFDLVEDPQLRAMFRDEIWMASSLRHPNVTSVLSWGEDEQGPFLVVEFVRGVSLSRLMRTVFTTGEAFTERLIVCLATSICAGLAAAHSLRSDNGEFLNLVHREVTPGNILMSFDGEVKIADFGLAKAKQRITQTAIGITKGEPAYMSPEQVCGQQLDGRSDIFALGVMLYELFAQRRPWTVTNVRHALSYIVQGEAPDLGRACPHIDRALIELVNRCLAKKREERFQSAAEVKAKLDHWLHVHGYTDSRDHLARFVRRNAMRQMRWVDRVIAGEAVEGGPSPFEMSNEVAPADEPMTRAELAPSRSGASRARALTESAIEAPDTAISKIDEPEATTTRRKRAGTLTVTNIPGMPRAEASTTGVTEQDSRAQPSFVAQLIEPGPVTEDSSGQPQVSLSATAGQPSMQASGARPSGGPDHASQHAASQHAASQHAAAHQQHSTTGQHSILDVRANIEPTPPPRVERPRTRAQTEPSTLRRSPPNPAELRDTALHITRAARLLADQAEQAAENARRAADHAELAASTAKDVAQRAERAAQAVRLAGQAMDLMASGNDHAAAEAILRAQALHDTATDES